MYAFIAAAWAAPVEVTPDEVAAIPPRRLYRYRERPPLVIAEVFAELERTRLVRFERRRTCEGFDLMAPRRDWRDELRAAADQVR